MTDFIDEEIEPELGRLCLYIGQHLIGEILNREVIVGTELIEHVLKLLSGDRIIGGVDMLGDARGARAAPFPCFTRCCFEGGLEAIELTLVVEFALELGNVGLLAVVAAEFVKNLNKDREQGIRLCLADDIGFLVDIEQNTLRGNGDGLFDVGAE